jgi:chemotaxis protein histidine kinase CheA
MAPTPDFQHTNYNGFKVTWIPIPGIDYKTNTMDYKNATQEEYDIRLRTKQFQQLMNAANKAYAQSQLTQYYEEKCKEQEKVNQILSAVNAYLHASLMKLRRIRLKYESTLPLKDLNYYRKLERDNAKLRNRIRLLKNKTI